MTNVWRRMREQYGDVMTRESWLSFLNGSELFSVILEANCNRVWIDKLLKKANSWKKEELTKFNISSSGLGVTKYAVNWDLPRSPDLIDHLSDDGE